MYYTFAVGALVGGIKDVLPEVGQAFELQKLKKQPKITIVVPKMPKTVLMGSGTVIRKVLSWLIQIEEWKVC